MASRYERYIDRKEERNKRPNVTKRAVNTLRGAALFGATAATVAFGGYSVAKAIGPDKVLRGASKGLNTVTRGLEFTSGLGKGYFRTARSAGWRNTFAGRAQEELTGNLKTTMRPWAMNKAGTSGVGGSELRAEKLLSSLRTYSKQSNDFAAEALRQEVLRKKIEVMPGLTKEMKERMTEMTSTSARPFKTIFSSAVEATDTRSREQIVSQSIDSYVKSNRLTDGFSAKEQTTFGSAIGSLKKSFYETSDRASFIKNNQQEVLDRAKKLREAFVKSTVDSAQETYTSKTIGAPRKFGEATSDFAMKRATIGDMRAHGGFTGRKHGQQSMEEFISSVIEAAPEIADKIDDLAIDPSVFVDKYGKLTDIRGVRGGLDRATQTLYNEFQLPFLGIRPLGFLREVVPRDRFEYASYTFEQGVTTNLGSTVGKVPDRTFFLGGRLINSTGDIIEDKVFLTRFGPDKRALLGMDSASRFNDKFTQLKESDDLLDKARLFADVGLSENRGLFGNLVARFSKTDDPMWTHNIVRGIESGKQAYRSENWLKEVLKKSRRIITAETKPLRRADLELAEEAITGIFGQDFYKILTSGGTEDTVRGAMRYVVDNSDASDIVGKKATNRFKDILSALDADSEIFHRIKSSRSTDLDSFADNFLKSINVDYAESVKYGDVFTQELHKSIYDSIIFRKTGVPIEETIQQTFKGADSSAVKRLVNMDLLSRFSGYEDRHVSDMYNFIAGSGGLAGSHIRDKVARDRFTDIMRTAEPILGVGPQPIPAKPIGPDTPMLIRKSRIGESLLKTINDSITGDTFDIKTFGTGLGETAKRITKEAGFGAGRAGRGRLNEATEFTTGLYSMFNRLNDGLQSASLGLSKRHTGSTQDLALNLLTRRIALPLVAYGYLSYLNDQIGNFTGEEPSDVAIKGYASASLGMQKAKDTLGLNALGQRIGHITPGSEHLTASPFISPLRVATFGLIGDSRGYDEMHNYLTEGYEPIRKGRWWTFGSNTPWRGGRITSHYPSYYRRMLGEPKMTESLWGSEDEYWKNNFLPTPHNPLGPIKTWLLDPYHWEKKHQDSRPTAVYGGIPELEGIPLVGQGLDATIGRALKPIRRNPKLTKAHRTYLRDINEGIKEEFETQSAGSLQYITPGGRMTSKNLPMEGPYYHSEEGEPVYGVQGISQEPIAGGIPVNVVGSSSYSSPGYGAKQNRNALTAINAGYMDVSALRNQDRRTIRSLEDSIVAESLTSVTDPNSPGYRLNESIYGLEKILGFRGYAARQVFGDLNKPDTIFESSATSFGYERRFWDQQYGGRTRDLSEIVRRFIPRRRASIDTYNPIKNTMPQWLPSNKTYFLDFLHGDPFCVSGDTLIDTSSGFIKAEDIKIGNLILTDKGNRFPVSNLIKRPILDNEKAYKLTIANLDNKVPLEFSEGHPILVKKLKRCSFGSSCICRPNVRQDFCLDKNCSRKWDQTGLEYIQVKDITIGDAVVYPIPKEMDQDIYLEFDYEWRDAPRSNPYNISESLLLDEDFSWLLGLYCAEGSTSKASGQPQALVFSLNKNETDVIDKVSELLYKIFNKSPVKYTRDNNTDVVLLSAKVARIFNSIIPGNLYEKRIPKEIYLGNKEVKTSFLFGFMVGDGTVSRQYLIGTSANKNLILDLYRLSFEAGIPANYIERNTRTSYELSIHSFNLKELNIDFLMEKGKKLPRSFNRQPSILSWSDNNYIYSIITSKEEIDLDFVYGFEVDIDDSFCVIGFATHNTKVPFGEARLPGEGYESINELHSDQYFGRYGALDRMKILGDVAPWSQEYKYYSKVVSEMNKSGLFSEEEYNIAQRIRERVSERKQKYDFFPYKFKESGLKEESVTIQRVIDPYTFTTKEFGNVPIKLAGIKGPRSPNTEEGAAIGEISSQYLYSGAKVRIGYSEDPLTMIRGDSMNSLSAVVYSGGTKVQQAMLSSSDLIEANYEATDPATVHALYGGVERAVGRAWETISHIDTPFHTKFLNVRSPLETYERNIFYGKEFQSWDTPYKSWIKPTINKGARLNPIVGTASGALMGSFFARSKEGKMVSAVIGATIGFTSTSNRTLTEATGKLFDSNYIWTPKETKKVRDVDEYFDKISYIKYKGLYEKAKRAALKYENVNIDEFFNTLDDTSGMNSGEARKLNQIKSLIKSTMGDSLVDQHEAQARIDAINDRLAEISGRKQGVFLGPISTQAIEYRRAYESTLHGADPHGDLLDIYNALPKRDRPFFQEFLKAKPSERAKILRMVPKNQRPFYQAKWGLKIDNKESLTQYFARKTLPGPEWKGWKPDESLEEVKLKFIDQKGLDLSEFGFWKDDLKEIGDYTPDIEEPKFRPMSLDLYKLKAVLEGRGIKNVDIYISKEQTQDPRSPFELNLDVKHDRRHEVVSILNKNVTSLLAR